MFTILSYESSAKQLLIKPIQAGPRIGRAEDSERTLRGRTLRRLLPGTPAPHLRLLGPDAAHPQHLRPRRPIHRHLPPSEALLALAIPFQVGPRHGLPHKPHLRALAARPNLEVLHLLRAAGDRTVAAARVQSEVHDSHSRLHAR